MIVSWCYKQKEFIVWLLVKSLSCVWLFVSPWTVAYQVPPSMGFSRQEYWNGLPLALRQCIYCCCCSFTKSCSTLCNPMDCSTPGSSVLHYLPEFAQILVHGVDDGIQPSHPLLPSSLFSFNLSQHQGLFQWVSYLHQVVKYWSFSISSSNEYLGLISFRIDWFDLLAVQGTLKSPFQHHSSKPSILWH